MRLHGERHGGKNRCCDRTDGGTRVSTGADGDTHIHAFANADSGSDTHTDACADICTDTHADADACADTCTDTHGDADACADTRADSDTHTDTGAPAVRLVRLVEDGPLQRRLGENVRLLLGLQR